MSNAQSATQVFRHRFDCPADYLHHRDPYLLVDSIDKIEEHSVTMRHIVKADAFFVTGHFPGAPIVPGAIMQEMTTQTAGILIAANFNPMQVYNTHDPDFNKYALGVLVKIKHGKYRGFARPSDELTITAELEAQVGDVFDFKGKITNAGKAIYQNRFQLVNVRADELRNRDY